MEVLATTEVKEYNPVPQHGFTASKGSVKVCCILKLHLCFVTQLLRRPEEVPSQWVDRQRGGDGNFRSFLGQGDGLVELSELLFALEDEVGVRRLCDRQAVTGAQT